MDQQRLEQFWSRIAGEDIALLATGVPGSVTMRTVSPVRYQDGILIFTAPGSMKYRQMQENAVCCLAVKEFFAEANVEFLGDTMQACNEPLRRVYEEKFQGAFDEGMENGGQGMEFMLLKPVRISGWAFGDDAAGDGMPTIPFELTL